MNIKTTKNFQTKKSVNREKLCITASSSTLALACILNASAFAMDVEQNYNNRAITIEMDCEKEQGVNHNLSGNKRSFNQFSSKEKPEDNAYENSPQIPLFFQIKDIRIHHLMPFLDTQSFARWQRVCKNFYLEGQEYVKEYVRKNMEETRLFLEAYYQEPDPIPQDNRRFTVRIDTLNSLAYYIAPCLMRNATLPNYEVPNSSELQSIFLDQLSEEDEKISKVELYATSHTNILGLQKRLIFLQRGLDTVFEDLAYLESDSRKRRLDDIATIKKYLAKNDALFDPNLRIWESVPSVFHGFSESFDEECYGYQINRDPYEDMRSMRKRVFELYKNSRVQIGESESESESSFEESEYIREDIEKKRIVVSTYYPESSIVQDNRKLTLRVDTLHSLTPCLMEYATLPNHEVPSPSELQSIFPDQLSEEDRRVSEVEPNATSHTNMLGLQKRIICLKRGFDTAFGDLAYFLAYFQTESKKRRLDNIATIKEYLAENEALFDPLLYIWNSVPLGSSIPSNECYGYEIDRDPYKNVRSMSKKIFKLYKKSVSPIYK